MNTHTPTTTNIMRAVSLVPSFFGLLACWAIFGDKDSFSSPVFDVTRDIAPLEWWGLGWGVGGILCFAGLARGYWTPFVIGNSLIAGMSAVWLAQLVYARWWQHVPVSGLAFGLWMWPLTIPPIMVWRAANVKREADHLQRALEGVLDAANSPQSD